MQEVEDVRSATARRLRSVPALDGLRGVAVLLVVISHLPFIVPTGIGGHLIDGYVDGGFLGVDMFFVLSGFLITALLLGEESRHGSIRLGSFYGRRALRLLPALYVLLVVHLIYAKVVGLPLDNELMTIRWALVYATNWQVVFHFFTVAQGLGHLWSLAIEEQFYLVWPLLLILFLSLRRGAGTVTTFLVALIGLVALRRFLMIADGTSTLLIFTRTDTRVDSLLVGCLLASLWVRRRTPTRNLAPAAWVAAAAIAACVAFSRYDHHFLYQGGFTVFAVAAATLILAAIDGDWAGNRLLCTAPLRLLGRVSYGLYLWHLPIFYAVAREWPDWPPVARVVVALALTALFTAASWHFVERPALRLKRRLEPS
jgi:peptidoglycan/LPS O-acetylase OafA/YrhL